MSSTAFERGPSRQRVGQSPRRVWCPLAPRTRRLLRSGRDTQRKPYLSPVDDYGSPRGGSTNGEPVMAAAEEDHQPAGSAPSTDQWHDAVTGLPRPPSFLAGLERALARMHMQARRVAVRAARSDRLRMAQTRSRASGRRRAAAHRSRAPACAKCRTRLSSPASAMPSSRSSSPTWIRKFRRRIWRPGCWSASASRARSVAGSCAAR